jgi:tetratricopeptide (TPR) repeat protein
VAYLAADRYMYLCLPGVGIATAALLQRSGSRRMVGVACAVLLACALLTVVQNGHWRDEHTLWRHAAAVNPGSTWVRLAAARSYLATGELEKARENAREAVRLSSYNVEAYLTLARIEERRGDLAEALKNYQLFAALGQVDFPQEAARVEGYIPLLRAKILGPGTGDRGPGKAE